MDTYFMISATLETTPGENTLACATMASIETLNSSFLSISHLVGKRESKRETVLTLVSEKISSPGTWPGPS